MARSSIILVFTLLVAPCASLKMKTEEGLAAKAVPNAVNCQQSEYHGMYNANDKSCRVYHHYATTDDGAPSNLPEKDGFMHTEFKVDELSDTQKWKVHVNSWSQPTAWDFMIETADGSLLSDVGIDCTLDWGIEGHITHCVNGAEWQAARWVEATYENIHRSKHALKDTKKSIKSYKKAASVIGKKWRDETKEKMKGFRDELNGARKIMEMSREARDAKKNK